MIRIYGAPNTRSTRVLWVLEEAKAEYEYKKVRLMKGEGRQASYLSLNPGGKVPTMQHDDLVLTESAAICTYISDLFVEANLIPACGTVERAMYNQWCFFAMTELEQPLWSMAKHRFALPKQYRIAEMQVTAQYEFEKALHVLSLGLAEREFLIADRITSADIIIAGILSWAKFGAQQPLSLQHDNIEQFLQRMHKRKSFQRVQKREQGE